LAVANLHHDPGGAVVVAIATACDDAAMVEYGNGVGEVAGQAGGGSGGSGSMDVGASLSRFVTDSVDTISASTPLTLFAIFLVIVVGLIVLKRAF
jgi:hypothetical protein